MLCVVNSATHIVKSVSTIKAENEDQLMPDGTANPVWHEIQWLDAEETVPNPAYWPCPDGCYMAKDDGSGVGKGSTYDPDTEVFDNHDPAPPTVAELALSDIATLEESVTPRREREATLTDTGKAWLQDVEDQIVIERAKL